MDIAWIREQSLQDPKNFIAQCDAYYADQFKDAASMIVARRPISPVILLSGYSGSGKTTTAEKIAERLKRYGIDCHMISLDDYYRTRADGGYPRTETGELDLESPLGLDIELLNAQMAALERYEEISVPHFDFTTQARDESKWRKLHLKENEVVLFEGINALNPIFTEKNPRATRIFVAPLSPLTQNGDVILGGEELRVLRRCVRDYNFRNYSPLQTLGMWHNIRRGERLYINPFKDAAHIVIDTAHGYELPVLGYLAKPLFEQLPPDAPFKYITDSILRVLPELPQLDAALLRPDCLLKKEFMK